MITTSNVLLLYLGLLIILFIIAAIVLMIGFKRANQRKYRTTEFKGGARADSTDQGPYAERPREESSNNANINRRHENARDLSSAIPRNRAEKDEHHS